MQKEIMVWKNFRQEKVMSVQSYTQDFRRRVLILGVELSSQDTLLKYIGGLHSYLRHTILMFNSTKLDEVCVQTTHLEERGKNVPQETSKKPFKSGDKREGKFKGKDEKNASIKKEGEKITCKHCSKEGHYENHYWKLHLELRPKKFNNKEKENTVATTQQDLGSHFLDETKITAMGLKGKDSIVSTSSSSKPIETQNEK